MDSALEVNGDVVHPLKLSVDDVREYTAYTIAVSFQNSDRTVNATFTGARLWDILQTAGLNPGGFPKRRVMARARDSFRCMLRWHEIDPALAGNMILVAYEQDGRRWEKGGPLRLAVPGDAQGMRYLRGLALLTVQDRNDDDEQEPDERP